MGADTKTIECLRGGGTQCYCLRTSPTAKRCLGVCWDQIEALLCSEEGKAQEERVLAQRAAEKQADAAEKVAEWMPGDDEMADEPPLHDPLVDEIDDPHHYMHPAFDGTCDETTATERTTDCVTHDEEIKVRLPVRVCVL